MQSDHLHFEELLTVTVPLRLTKIEVMELSQQISRHHIAKPTPDVMTGGSLVERAKWMLRFERKRRKLPGIEPIVGDPAWQILLDLYVRDAAGQSTTVSSATLASGSPPTTGLRYVTALAANGYIQRVAHPEDNRSVLVSLTAKGRAFIGDLLRDAD